MKRYKYAINEKVICVDTISYCTYGIDVFDITYESPILLFQINDISIDKATVEELIHNCNILNASPIHIYEIIEDIL